MTYFGKRSTLVATVWCNGTNMTSERELQNGSVFTNQACGVLEIKSYVPRRKNDKCCTFKKKKKKNKY